MRENSPATQHQSGWGLIALVFFIFSLVAIGYFAFQIRPSSPLPANFLAAEKEYGVTIDLTQYDSASASRKDPVGDKTTLTKTFIALHENGLVWLRQPVSWAKIEPAPGQFDWQALDQVVAQTAGRPAEIKLIFVLQTTPTWARPANTPPLTPPTEVGDFGNFARTLAERYGNKVDYYQIWHEPNLSPNWGNTFVSPSAYADLLREAALNIRQVDPTAFILAAALAPNLETGPLNLDELDYLDQLYQAKANRWFDIVAGQCYGFDSEPSDPARNDTLNFRRLELLRQVMLKHGDVATPIWATAFGWNALPPHWTGQLSPWKSAPPPLQAERTAVALAYARSNWPWLGPILAIRWDAANLTSDDPTRGFALEETPPVLSAFRTVAVSTPVATVGFYPANHPTGRYSSGWRFALSQADIPRHEPRTLTIPFEGTRLDLTIDRGPFRGYLWVTIDGQPANALPQDSYPLQDSSGTPTQNDYLLRDAKRYGQSYVTLYDPLRESEPVTLAEYLPPGPHEAVIEAEGGWGQWPISGWTVYNEVDKRPAQTGLIIAVIVALLSGIGWLRGISCAPDETFKRLWAWGEIVVALYAILREQGQIWLTFILAFTFYLAPEKIALALLPLLTLVILLRPDLGLALVAFSLSFFQAPKQLPLGNFSPVELTLVLTVVGFIFRELLAWGRIRYAPSESQPLHFLRLFSHPEGNGGSRMFYSIDWAALALVILAFAATLAAQKFGVSLREWRVVVFESVIFYFLARLGLDYRPPKLAIDQNLETEHRSQSRISNGRDLLNTQLPPPWAWRLIDAFVAGAVLQALIALYLYFFTDRSITAEGVHRALGFAYGSPNNLSLFLDRAWPILLAATIWPPFSRKRWFYGAGLLVVSITIYLTFSKGALFLGLPAGIAVMGIWYRQRSQKLNWRKLLLALVVGLIIIAIAFIPLSQTERFRATFDFEQGSTGFFRLKLWQASLTMLREHWPLGVGLDNFLYQYRTRYILPDAWQEPNLSHPHNLFLDFGARLGIGGLIVLLWLQVAFWRNAWRLDKKSPSVLLLGLAGSMAVFLAHGLVDNSYFLVDLAFVFFLTVGVTQGIYCFDKKDSPLYNKNVT